MITDSFDKNGSSVINLEAFYGPKKNLVQKCLIIFSKLIYDEMLRQYSCRQIGEVTACNGNRTVWAFSHGGEEMAFYLTPIGSALAGSTVAEVNHLTGATKFIMFGSCGSLDGEATKGRFVIPTQAYRGEGLSYYYAAPQDYIAIKNADCVAEIFAGLHIPYVKGRVWTTDSMLRETVQLVRQRKQEGCIAVEMELAGVQAVCDFIGLELYDFLAAGDVLMDDSYENAGLSDANHNTDKLQIALRIAESI